MTPLEFLAARQSIPVSQIGEPGPDDATLRAILTLGLRVPDHGRLEPWRLIVYRGEARALAGRAIANRLDARDGPLTPDERDREEKRLSRAPVVIGVVSSPKAHPRIPEWEQFLSAGAVAFMITLAARAHGFASNWVTGWFSDDAEARRMLGVAPHERIAGFVHIGSFDGMFPERPRPDLDQLVNDYDGPWPA
ncbi:MAG: nitroreductase [Rhizobiaceae bacterium]|jgi:nitroreductase|nr:nitroreductase [Rhizobiaceae bacterium]